MPKLKKILLLDKDETLRDTLKDQFLRAKEFELFDVAGPEAALEFLSNHTVHLIILDTELPDINSAAFTQLLRQRGYVNPFIFLGHFEEIPSSFQALNLGAYDYIVKPFRFSALQARVRLQLRQLDKSEDAAYRIGPYSFKPALKLLVGAGEEKIRLTEKETAILRYLYQAQEQIISRDILLHEVWGYNAGVTTHTLETHIYRLRQKIEPELGRVQLLVTENGGYKLVP